jgi:hypothetical protein
VRRHHQDRDWLRQRTSPGGQLRRPERIVNQWRCSVPEVHGRHSVAVCAGGCPFRDVGGSVPWHGLVFWQVRLELLIHCLPALLMKFLIGDGNATGYMIALSSLGTAS